MMLIVKRASQRLGLLFFGAFLSVLILEGIFRIYWPYSDRLWQPNEFYGWRLIPSNESVFRDAYSNIATQVTTNSKGLRDDEYPYQRKPETFRILVLGDSFTEGFHVERHESFCERLELLLNREQKGAEFEVINAGVSGYGTDNQLLFFRHEGCKYEPDLVLLATYIGNDFSDNYPGWPGTFPKPYFVLEEGGLQLRNFPVEVNPMGLNNHLKQFLRKHSRVYRFITLTLTTKATSFNLLLKKLGLMGTDVNEFKQEDMARAYFRFTTEDSPEWNEAWRITKALIQQLNSEVMQINARLSVVLIPDPLQVHQESWVETLNSNPIMKKMSWDLEKPNHYFGEFFQNQRIEYLDLLPYMKKIAVKKDVILYRDKIGHWNAEGHATAAKLIYDFLLMKIMKKAKIISKTKQHEKAHSSL